MNGVEGQRGGRRRLYTLIKIPNFPFHSLFFYFYLFTLAFVLSFFSFTFLGVMGWAEPKIATFLYGKFSRHYQQTYGRMLSIS